LLTTSGGTSPYTFSINSGSLPAGVTLDSSGLLSGTPNVDGTFSFNVHVVDSGAPTATGDQPYTWTINPPVSVEPPTLNAMVQGITFMGGCYSVGGTPAYTYSVVGGALPAGLTLDVGGTINGAPTVVGPYSVTIQSTDSVGATGTRTYTGEVVPEDIEVQASTDFAVAAIAMPYQGWAFGNMGTGMGSPSIRFVQISGSTQSVRITLRNNSTQTFLVNVNSINYAVYASENFDKTFAVPQNGIMTVGALTGGFFPASSVTGAVYVNAPADCAYRLKLTPTVRAVEGDEGSLDTSVINGRSMQRTGYLTITENVTQVKVMELPDGSCINTQIQQLPDVIPLITDGYPQG